MEKQEILNIRKAMNWTQVQMAEFLEVKPLTVSRWETGVTHPLPVFVSKMLRLRGDAGRRSANAS